VTPVNGLKYLLDTNVLSEPLKARPDPRVERRLRQHSGELATSTVVWHELWFGASRLPESRARTVIEAYLREVVGVTVEILSCDQNAAAWHAAERARLERQGKRPPFVDGLIAATAVSHDLILVTRNRRDFAGFQDLRVQDWFTRS
jgi:tRNA(fMet)-specific endonuclease VapC